MHTHRRPARRWAVPLVGLLWTMFVLSGCTPAQPSAAPPKQITITLADGKAEPIGERVVLSRGQTLVLTITSDRNDQVHVHGYDLEIPIAKGQTTTTEIVVDKIGRFEVETHEPVFTVLVLQVQ